MTYTVDRIFSDTAFEEIDQRTRSALQSKGFGVLTEIDVKATMKKKMDVDMDDYRILGACNPKMAYQAIELEPKVGAMLPCNVILRKTNEGVQVSAIDPIASMQAIDNDELKTLAAQVRSMLTDAIQAI
ncbi:MAG: DUF302 domain-containing protein [Gammaproteobacteria bacterium]|nr:DUF302 domain-containing protein [Gammaproteobacteria bacterium]